MLASRPVNLVISKSFPVERSAHHSFSPESGRRLHIDRECGQRDELPPRRSSCAFTGNHPGLASFLKTRRFAETFCNIMTSILGDLCQTPWRQHVPRRCPAKLPCNFFAQTFQFQHRAMTTANKITVVRILM